MGVKSQYMPLLAVDATQLKALGDAVEMLDNWADSNSKKIDAVTNYLKRANDLQMQRDAAILNGLDELRSLIEGLRTAIVMSNTREHNPKLDKALDTLIDTLNQ